MSALEDWITAQRNAIIANARGWDTPPAVAMMGTQWLGLDYGGYEGRSTRWNPLAGVDPQVAMVQETGVVTSLWLDPRKSNYVSLFRTFLTQHCGVDASGLTNENDVDHMFNRERAIQFGYAYVRMFPIPPGPNRSHGAGYEKAMTAADEGRRAKVLKLMDEVSFMKFFGILSPSVNGGFSASQRGHMQAMADIFDLPVEQIEQGVSGLMSRAHGR